MRRFAGRKKKPPRPRPLGDGPGAGIVYTCPVCGAWWVTPPPFYGRCCSRICHEFACRLADPDQPAPKRPAAAAHLAGVPELTQGEYLLMALAAAHGEAQFESPAAAAAEAIVVRRSEAIRNAPGRPVSNGDRSPDEPRVKRMVMAPAAHAGAEGHYLYKAEG